jgi:hypothetical protein
MVEWHTVAQDVNKRRDRGFDRQEFAHSVRCGSRGRPALAVSVTDDVAAGRRVGAPGRREAAWPFCHASTAGHRAN